jgi:hypothetical protein
MKAARTFLAAGALLLILTAAVHSLGSSMVSGWLEGERRSILMAAWFLLAVDWIVVALVWLYCARRASRSLAPIIYLTGLVPAATAVALLIAVGPAFFGIWMLVGALILAAVGAARLH